MTRDRLLAVALVSTVLGLAAPAFAQPGCNQYDDGGLRPPSDPNPEVACGGPGPAAPPGPQLGTGSITTSFNSNNQFAGNTFDLDPNVNMMITSFDVNLTTGSSTTMNVYWRTGTAFGFESSAAGWTSIGTAAVTPAGTNIPTPTPIGGLSLTANTLYGFYVDTQSYPSASLRYTNGGPTVFSNADVDLTTFHGKGNPAFTGSSFFPRQWNGTVYYDILQDADLDLTKTVDPTVVQPGGTVTYTLTVTNNGPDPANNTVVTDNLPAEFTWTGDDCGAGPPAGGPPNGTLTWNVGNLANGASATCNVTGTVDGPNGTIASNSATATSDSTDPTPPTAVATVTIQLSVLEIPTLSRIGIALLLLLLAGAAVWALRRAPQV